MEASPAVSLSPAEDIKSSRVLSRHSSRQRLEVPKADAPDGTKRLSHLMEKRLSWNLNKGLTSLEMMLEEEGRKYAMEEAQTSYRPFSADVWTAYHKIVGLVRDLNTQIEVPEIVLVGKEGQHKTSLLEAFLGHKITHSNAYSPTRRPLHLTTVHNPAREIPKITILKDTVLHGSEFDRHVEVTISELPNAIHKRNVPSSKPIFVLYESSSMVNLTFVDTPGLPRQQLPSAPRSEVERTVIELSKPSVDQSRVILCVEECGSKGWGSMETLGWVRKMLDFKLERTLLVLTGFDKFLLEINNINQYAAFIKSQPVPIKTFFATLPGHGSIALSDASEFKNQVHSLARSDSLIVSKLAPPNDTSPSVTIGLFGLRRFLLRLALATYEDALPLLVALQEERRAKAQDALQRIERQRAMLTPFYLRSLASSLTVSFLHTVERLLMGSLEGDPVINGQTIEEEKSDEGTSTSWIDGENRVVYVDSDWTALIPFAEVRLYGAQQLERLLAEFRMVVEHLEPTVASRQEIATLSGLSCDSDTFDYALVASDIAQLYSRSSLETLIGTLHRRAVYVMKRIGTVARIVLCSGKPAVQGSSMDQEGQSMFSTGDSLPSLSFFSPSPTSSEPTASSTTASSSSSSSMASSSQPKVMQQPLFLNALVDIYSDFIESLGEIFLAKSAEEFYSSELIAFELKHLEGLGDEVRHDIESKAPYDRVIAVAAHLFTRICRRVMRQVSLKCYSMFLIPTKSTMRSVIHSRVMELTDSQLLEFFGSENLKHQLRLEELPLHKRIEIISEKEQELGNLVNELGLRL